MSFCDIKDLRNLRFMLFLLLSFTVSALRQKQTYSNDWHYLAFSEKIAVMTAVATVFGPSWILMISPIFSFGRMSARVPAENGCIVARIVTSNAGGTSV